MTFHWTRKLRPPQREANETREQTTVVISRKANAWPFGENTGLFGGSLMWVVEALAAAPPKAGLYFHPFNDAFELSAGVQTTHSLQDRRAISVPVG